MDTNFFDEFLRLRHEMNRFMNHLQNLTKIPAGFSTTPWVPQVNIYENETQFIILAEIPGIDPDDLKVSVHDNTVTIKGEKKPSDVVADTRCKHMEISFGPFARTIELPEPVDSEDIQAKYRQGFLEIKLPKRKPERGVREIPIESKD